MGPRRPYQSGTSNSESVPQLSQAERIPDKHPFVDNFKPVSHPLNAQVLLVYTPRSLVRDMVSKRISMQEIVLRFVTTIVVVGPSQDAAMYAELADTVAW